MMMFDQSIHNRKLEQNRKHTHAPLCPEGEQQFISRPLFEIFTVQRSIFKFETSPHCKSFSLSRRWPQHIVGHKKADRTHCHYNHEE